ncbi:hypothetical protein [Rhodosalinus sediminis]|nr:hypothetical protein [Rhodosalinus sediminis]
MTGHATFRETLTPGRARRFMAERRSCRGPFEARGSAGSRAREMAVMSRAVVRELATTCFDVAGVARSPGGARRREPRHTCPTSPAARRDGAPLILPVDLPPVDLPPVKLDPVVAAGCALPPAAAAGPDAPAL